MAMRSAFTKHWMPLEVAPLVVAVGVGSTLAGVTIMHHLKNNPDVNTKTQDSKYRWQAFSDEHKPYLNFGAGAPLNEKVTKFVKERKHQ